jgi:paraquat-inducible protein B
MAKKTNSALVGAFVLGAVLLTFLAVVIWGSRALFERKHEYICYFPGSVNGLATGAPVKYRGVEVGVVKDIRVRFHQAPEDRRIPVFIELWGKRVIGLGGGEPTPELMQELVANGLRARLASLSLVTGVMYVSFDDVPGSRLFLSELPGAGALPEIPTLPTEFDEVTKAVGDLLSSLSSTDFKELSESVTDAMHGVGELATSGDLRSTIQKLPPLLSRVHALARSLNAAADQSGPVIDDAHGALTALTETLETTKGTIGPQAPLPVDVAATLTDVDKAAIAVRELADFLRRNPHSIVAGTKPRGAGP